MGWRLRVFWWRAALRRIRGSQGAPVRRASVAARAWPAVGARRTMPAARGKARTMLAETTVDKGVRTARAQVAVVLAASAAMRAARPAKVVRAQRARAGLPGAAVRLVTPVG